MKIERNGGGTWDVIRDDGTVAATFPDNGAAWRWLDRNEIHPGHMTRAGADRLGGWTLPKG